MQRGSTLSHNGTALRRHPAPSSLLCPGFRGCGTQLRIVASAQQVFKPCSISIRAASVRSVARPGRASRRLTCSPKAMVNVDFASPSLVLGVMLIGCGVLLLQMRNLQTKVSRDADIVVAAMISIVGSTLIFQGWRLDPLLLLCQALTTSVAVWYGIETFRLRSKEEEGDASVGGFLPPPAAGAPQGMYGQAPGQQQQQGAPFAEAQQWPPQGPLPGAPYQPLQQQQQQQQQPFQDLLRGFQGNGGTQGGQQAQPGQYGSPAAGGGMYLPPASTQEYPWYAAGGSADAAQQPQQQEYTMQGGEPVYYASQQQQQQQQQVPQGGYASPASWGSGSSSEPASGEPEASFWGRLAAAGRSVMQGQAPAQAQQDQPGYPGAYPGDNGSYGNTGLYLNSSSSSSLSPAQQGYAAPVGTGSEPDASGFYSTGTQYDAGVQPLYGNRPSQPEAAPAGDAYWQPPVQQQQWDAAVPQQQQQLQQAPPEVPLVPKKPAPLRVYERVDDWE